MFVLLKIVEDEAILYSFTDRLSYKNCELDCFTRTYKDKTYSFVSGYQVLYEQSLESVFIQPKDKKSESKNKLITLDTETRKLENGDLEVISIALYDGKDYNT